MKRAYFTRGFCAAHRVWNDKGLCANIHGHNYTAQIMVDIEDGDLTESGFVVGFDVVKKAVDRYDHSLILDISDPLLDKLKPAIGELKVWCVHGPPSTEFMAQRLTDEIAAAIAEGNPAAARFVVEVALRETPSIEAFGRTMWPIGEF